MRLPAIAVSMALSLVFLPAGHAAQDTGLDPTLRYTCKSETNACTCDSYDDCQNMIKEVCSGGFTCDTSGSGYECCCRWRSGDWESCRQAASRPDAGPRGVVPDQRIAPRTRDRRSTPRLRDHRSNNPARR